MIKLIHPFPGALGFRNDRHIWHERAIRVRCHSGSGKAHRTVGFLAADPGACCDPWYRCHLSGGGRAGLIGAKLKCMPFIAGKGMLVLIPSALFLAAKAQAAEIRCPVLCCASDRTCRPTDAEQGVIFNLQRVKAQIAKAIAAYQRNYNSGNSHHPQPRRTLLGRVSIAQRLSRAAERVFKFPAPAIGRARPLESATPFVSPVPWSAGIKAAVRLGRGDGRDRKIPRLRLTSKARACRET